MSFQSILDTLSAKPAPAGNRRCPGCGAAIPLADVNVATDRALCRACGRDWSYQAVASAAQVADAPKMAPKGVEEESGMGNLRLVVKRKPKILWFLIPFFLVHGGAFAGAGIAMLAGQLNDKQGNPQAPSLMGLVFAAPGILELLALVFLLTAKWIVTVEAGHGTVHYGLGRGFWTRHFTLSKESAVFLADSSTRVNGKPMVGVCVENQGQRLVFGSTLPDDVKNYVASSLQRLAHKGR